MLLAFTMVSFGEMEVFKQDMMTRRRSLRRTRTRAIALQSNMMYHSALEGSSTILSI